jgi:recombination protein RecT
VKWEDQMAIKSVIKRAEKLLPTSSDRLARVIEHDNEAMGFESFNQRGADATALTQEASAPALTDQREAQAKSTLRPSRMAGIVAQAKAAQPVQEVTPAQQAAAGLPTEPPADDGPPWHDAPAADIAA